MPIKVAFWEEDLTEAPRASKGICRIKRSMPWLKGKEVCGPESLEVRRAYG